MLPHDVQQGVHRSLDRGADAVTLDVRQHHLITAAQLVQQGRPVMIDGVTVEEVVEAFESIDMNPEQLTNGMKGIINIRALIPLHAIPVVQGNRSRK